MKPIRPGQKAPYTLESFRVVEGIPLRSGGIMYACPYCPEHGTLPPDENIVEERGLKPEYIMFICSKEGKTWLLHNKKGEIGSTSEIIQ